MLSSFDAEWWGVASDKKVHTYFARCSTQSDRDAPFPVVYQQQRLGLLALQTDWTDNDHHMDMRRFLQVWGLTVPA